MLVSVEDSSVSFDCSIEPIYDIKAPAPPPPASTNTTTGPKDNSLCIIPGCQNTKYVDQSTNSTHDYCGKTCAGIGKARGIFG